MSLPDANRRPADRLPAESQLNPNEGLPPFVKTWPRLYGVIVGVLVLLIVLFYAFMIHFQ